MTEQTAFTSLDFSVWTASVLCAAAVSIECIRVLISDTRDHFMLRNDWFLLFYAAGIVQWTVYGLRSGLLSIIVPCAIQLLLMLPVLIRWGKLRLA